MEEDGKHRSDLIDFSVSIRRRKLPSFVQAEAAECGLVCLAMIAVFHGDASADPTSLRRRFSTSLKGATLGQIIRMATQLEMTCRPVRAELEFLPSLKTPCVLHWNMNHFVVLKSVSKHHARIHDPALGARDVSLDELSKSFTGVALEVIPGPKFEPKRPSETGLSIRSMFWKVAGLKSAFAGIFLLALLLEVFALATPLFAQTVMDQVIVSRDIDLLIVLSIGFSLLLIAETLITALRSWIVTCLNADLGLSWMSSVFAQLTRLPEEYYAKRHLGDIGSRFDSVNVIQRTVTSGFVTAIFDGMMALITLGALYVYSSILASITLFAAAAYASLRFFTYRRQSEASLQVITAAAKQQSLFLESVRGSQTLKLHNQAAPQSAKFANLSADTLNMGIVAQKLELVFVSGNSLIIGMQRIAILALGAVIVIDGELTVGMLVAFTAYASLFTTRVSKFIDYAIEMKLLSVHSQRLSDIVLQTPEVNVHGEANVTLKDVEPSVELRGVGYRYSDDDPWIFRGLDLRIESGESVAIVGPSGCGKTTLAKVLMGIYDPTEGEVLIGGYTVRQLGKENIRDMLGVVMQEDHLFNGTIQQNIAFGVEDSVGSEVEDAARAAHIHEEIVRMPMKYHTLVGDMGSTLSGGQRQRLLLARAIYKKPKILILDEATSSLDISMERKVNSSVKALNATRIVVAHRPQTIAMADRTIILDQTERRQLQ